MRYGSIKLTRSNVDMEHSLTEGVSNLLQHHTNEIVRSMPDERDYLRGWRRSFRDIVAAGKSQMLNFLKADSELTGTDFFVQALSSPPQSSWLLQNLERPYDISGTYALLDTELGVPLEMLRNNLHAAMELYNTTLVELFAADERLCRKLDELDNAENRLKGFDFDTEGGKQTGLDTALANYMSWMYENKQIKGDYSEFCRLYTRWNALRSIVLARHVADSDTTGGPICSICTADRICMVLLPCGHTFCNNCGQKQRSQCYICRTTLGEKHRIYFS